MKRQETCYHHNLRPILWNQPQPEPYTGFTCDCGMNFTCPICGYGHGCYPCECHKKIAAQNIKESTAHLTTAALRSPSAHSRATS